MLRITIALALAALLSGCASYTERTSPCVCNWEPLNSTGEARV